MSFNSISSIGPTNGANWNSPEENVNAFRQAAFGSSARALPPKPKMASVPFTGAFDHLKNYVKRIGLALVGKDYTEKTKGQAYSIPTSIRPEKNIPVADSDPTIGRWPSTFATPNEVPPPARTMNAPVQANLPSKAANEEFNRVMQEMAQSENEQKAAYELMKGAGTEALGLGAGLSAEGSSLGL